MGGSCCWSAVCVLGKSKGNYNDNWHIILNSWQPQLRRNRFVYFVLIHISPLGNEKCETAKKNCRTAGAAEREGETERERKTAEFFHCV